MARRKTRQSVTGRRPPTPPTPKVTPKPPTPTIQERERRGQRRAAPPTPAATWIQTAAQAAGTGTGLTWIQAAAQAAGTTAGYGEAGGQIGPAAPPKGIPGWNIPTGAYGAQTAGRLAQMYPGEAFMPTEMAKISRDVAIGITKGKWPFRVAQPIIERWGLSPEESRKWLQVSGYLEESPGLWRQGEVTGDGGDGAGGAGGGGRGRWPTPAAVSTRAGTSGRLINWRIGI